MVLKIISGRKGGSERAAAKFLRVAIGFDSCLKVS